MEHRVEWEVTLSRISTPTQQLHSYLSALETVNILQTTVIQFGSHQLEVSCYSLGILIEFHASEQ